MGSVISGIALFHNDDLGRFVVYMKLLRDGGMGIKEISKRLEIGVGSVYGALQT